MKDDSEKNSKKYLRQKRDFQSRKRKKYPDLLLPDIYVDNKKWGWPEPDGGSVGMLQTKEQQEERHQYRQEKCGELETKWALLCDIHGMEPAMPRSMAEWKKLCEKLANRHVPGFQITNTPPTPTPIKYPSTRRLDRDVALMKAVVEAKVRYAKTHHVAADKVKDAQAIRNLDNEFLAKWGLLKKWKVNKEKAVRSLRTRHSEAMKWDERYRGMGMPTLEELSRWAASQKSGSR